MRRSHAILALVFVLTWARPVVCEAGVADRREAALAPVQLADGCHELREATPAPAGPPAAELPLAPASLRAPISRMAGPLPAPLARHRALPLATPLRL